MHQDLFVDQEEQMQMSTVQVTGFEKRSQTITKAIQHC